MAARNSTIVDRMDLAAEICRQVGLCAVSRALPYVQYRELFSMCNVASSSLAARCACVGETNGIGCMRFRRDAVANSKL